MSVSYDSILLHQKKKEVLQAVLNWMSNKRQRYGLTSSEVGTRVMYIHVIEFIIVQLIVILLLLLFIIIYIYYIYLLYIFIIIIIIMIKILIL